MHFRDILDKLYFIKYNKLGVYIRPAWRADSIELYFLDMEYVYNNIHPELLNEFSNRYTMFYRSLIDKETEDYIVDIFKTKYLYTIINDYNIAAFRHDVELIMRKRFESLFIDKMRMEFSRHFIDEFMEYL